LAVQSRFLDNTKSLSRFFKVEIGTCPAFLSKVDGLPIHTLFLAASPIILPSQQEKKSRQRCLLLNLLHFCLVV